MPSNPAPAPTAAEIDAIRARARSDDSSLGPSTGLTDLDALRRDRDRLLAALASAEPERGAMMRAIRDGTGIEPCDDDGIENRTWIVPAEPEPVVCATLTEALIKFGALSDTDAERETATLTERLARENESVTISESQAADVLDEINAAIAAGRSMGHGAWAILNRVNGLLRSHQAEVQA